MLVGISAVVLAWPSSVAAEPPSGPDWLRTQLVMPDRMPGYAVSADYPVPLTDIISGGGEYFDTIRGGALRSAHLRAFISFDGRDEVAIRLVELVNRSFATAGVKPDGGMDVLPPMQATDAVVVRRSQADGSVKLSVRFTRGRVLAEMLVTRPGRGDEEADPAAALQSARAAADAQYAALAESPDLTARASISLERERRLLLVTFLATILWFQILVSLVGAVRDRATRERIALLLRPQRSRIRIADSIRVEDVSRIAGRRRLRLRAEVLVRWLVFAVAIAVSFRLPLMLQIGVLGGVVFLGSLVELAIARFRRRLSFRAAYGPSTLITSLVTTSLTIAFLGGAVLFVFINVMSTIATPTGATEDQVEQAATVFLAIGAFLAGAADLTNRLGRRLTLRGVQKLLNNDTRREILFLRSFMDDRLNVRAHRTGRHSLVERLTLRRFDRFEEIVTWTLWQYGPAVALGEPGSRLPPLGAVRLFVPDANWVDVITAKIQSSRMVVMNTGRTSAVVFEVERIRQACALARTVFVFPPVPGEELVRRLKVLANALNLRHEVLVPRYPGGRHLLALRFDAAGTPVVVVGSRRDDITYQAAIEAASAAVDAQSAVRLHTPAAPVLGGAQAAAMVLQVSPSRAYIRARNRRRWFAVAPWIASALIYCAGQLPNLPEPEAAVPVPGQTIARLRISAVAATNAGGVEPLDVAAKALVYIDPQGAQREVYTFATIPDRLLVDDATTFVTTRSPHGVTALHRTQGHYTVAWRMVLESEPGYLVSEDGRLYVTLPGRNVVVAIDVADGRLVGTGAPGRGPHAITAHNGQVIVGNLTDSTVTWLDSRTLAVMSTRQVGNPGALLVDGRTLFVSSVLEPAVTAVDLETDAPGRRAGYPRLTGVMAVNSEYVVVSTYERTPHVLVLDRATLAVRARHRLPSQAYDLTVAGTSIICSLPDDGVLVRIPLP